MNEEEWFQAIGKDQAQMSKAREIQARTLAHYRAQADLALELRDLKLELEMVRAERDYLTWRLEND